jgi:hypothetical protein
VVRDGTRRHIVPSADWFKNWIKQTKGWVWTDETYQQCWQDFQKSGVLFDTELDANNPNLESFRNAGGKLIMWQGLADRLIFTGGSINFYNEAIQANGGIQNNESFFRYFLAPGVGIAAPRAQEVSPRRHRCSRSSRGSRQAKHLRSSTPAARLTAPQ